MLQLIFFLYVTQNSIQLTKFNQYVVGPSICDVLIFVNIYNFKISCLVNNINIKILQEKDLVIFVGPSQLDNLRLLLLLFYFILVTQQLKGFFFYFFLFYVSLIHLQ